MTCSSLFVVVVVARPFRQQHINSVQPPAHLLSLQTSLGIPAQQLHDVALEIIRVDALEPLDLLSIAGDEKLGAEVPANLIRVSRLFL